MYIYIKFRGKTCSRLQSAGNLALLITINPTITATDAIAVVVVSLLARIEFYTASPKIMNQLTAFIVSLSLSFANSEFQYNNLRFHATSLNEY